MKTETTMKLSPELSELLSGRTEIDADRVMRELQEHWFAGQDDEEWRPGMCWSHEAMHWITLEMIRNLEEENQALRQKVKELTNEHEQD